jgi:hypothetical protein
MGARLLRALAPAAPIVGGVTVDFLREHGRIDSPVLVVVVLIVAIAWMWRRPEARGPRRLLLAYVTVYWLLATWTGATLPTPWSSSAAAPPRSVKAAR